MKKQTRQQQAVGINRAFIAAVLIAVGIIIVAGIALLGGGDTATSEVYLPEPGLISPTRYQELFVDSDVEHYLLDVRTIEEFNDGHIANAENIPVQVIEQYLEDIPTDMPVVLYCRSGNRSGQAALILENAGYTDVYDIDGGLVVWAEQDLPLQ